MDAIPAVPFYAYRTPKNLRNVLVRASVNRRTKEVAGNYKCGHSRCKTCPILMTTNEFTSHTRHYLLSTWQGSMEIK